MTGADANHPPDPSNPGQVLPPEGSARREELRRRTDELLRDLAEYGQQHLHPLHTRPVLDHSKALLCADCDALFEAATTGNGAADRRNSCPRCTSETNVRVTFRPVVDEDQQQEQ